MQFAQPGAYTVSANCATIHPASEILLEAAGQRLVGKVGRTGDWATFRDIELGQIDIKQPGEQQVKVRPRDAKTWKAINLTQVVLKPAK